ncbi:MAG TPA: TadE family protein [Pyrinomonadaceae bacterium]|jgi:Flp pilus assembly protein TadG|nr:TadE family protein [Pyrinomonadaceae bacterium]
MLRLKRNRRDERGAALVEFAIGSTIFLLVIFAVLEFGILLWTHNALTDATRRGARYAINQCNPGETACANSSTSVERTKNVVVYGDPNPSAGAKPILRGLEAANVQVNYSSFGVSAGRVTVSIDSYDYSFVLSMLGSAIRMPAYRTTLTGENAGYVPANL